MSDSLDTSKQHEEPAPLRHLLGLDGVPRSSIKQILDTAVHMKGIMFRPLKKVPALRGTTVDNFFVEPSTRTRTSFAMAEKYLSADTVSFLSLIHI